MNDENKLFSLASMHSALKCGYMCGGDEGPRTNKTLIQKMNV